MTEPYTVTIVVAVAANGVIGREGSLPWRLPGDLARVKKLTMGHVLVMGRRTFDSIGRPLPGRTTVVVTRQPDWKPEGVLVAGSVDAALEIAARHDREVFVFGGAEVYAAAIPRADRRVDQEPAGDTTFPEVDWHHWQEVGRETGEGYSVVEYERVRG
jgi:dihydrofolate reductase